MLPFLFISAMTWKRFSTKLNGAKIDTVRIFDVIIDMISNPERWVVFE